MKKTFLPVLVIAAFISLTIASCTKEQTLLDLLYGTWHYDSSLNSNGLPIPLGSDVVSYEGFLNFYKCYDKTEEFCTGTFKSTTTYTAISGLPTDISTGDFDYRVFGKTQILLDGTYYEIETVNKKTLVMHPAEQPLAVETYSKQK